MAMCDARSFKGKHAARVSERARAFQQMGDSAKI